MNKVIGVDAVVVWLGAEDEPENQYISFGEWDEADDEDTYGVLDSAIFFIQAQLNYLIYISKTSNEGGISSLTMRRS